MSKTQNVYNVGLHLHAFLTHKTIYASRSQDTFGELGKMTENGGGLGDILGFCNFYFLI